MNFKKLTVFTLLILFLISGVSASEITFKGVDFNIPDGFREVDGDESIIPDKGSESDAKFFTNEYGGNISIAVVSDFLGMNLDELKEPGANKTEINGHTGWSYKEGNVYYFSYLCNDKGVIVGAVNETPLGEVII